MNSHVLLSHPEVECATVFKLEQAIFAQVFLKYTYLLCLLYECYFLACNAIYLAEVQANTIFFHT